MRLRSGTLLVSCIFGAASAATAGTVNVSFVNPAHFTDAGTSSWDEKSNLDTLARYLEDLGQRLLPANQTLKVEVLDVDLAGTVVPSRLDASSIRVVRGRTDFPRLQLRYTLEENGRTLRSGEEWVVDLTYAQNFRGAYSDTPLYYEKHMLNGWFKQRFLDNRASAAG